MTQPTDTLPRLMLERTLAAPRALVWNAWTDPAALARWWGPDGFANPRCEIDPRSGGVIRIDMLAPDGAIYPMDGRIETFEPLTRLVFVTGALGADGKRLFEGLNTLTLEEVEGGTRLSLDVRITRIYDPAAAAHLAGMEAGWTQSLGRLEQSCVTQKTIFGAFSLKRNLGAAPSKVFAAFASATARASWFVAPSDLCAVNERSLDFRVGGRERLVGHWRNGRTTDFDAVYQDITPDRRIVYTYAMHVNAVRISVSLAVVEIEPHGAGTRLTLTEHGAFLDGYDDVSSREKGTSSLLDNLERALNAH